MNMTLTNAYQSLICQKPLSKEEFVSLLDNNSEKLREELATKASQVRRKIFGNIVYIRGLIELTNYCQNNCNYCGIQKDNLTVKRYRLTQDEILACCKEGYSLGFRTFVLQGGEDPYWGATKGNNPLENPSTATSSQEINPGERRLLQLISNIHEQFPDCAITLSLGERSKESYKRLYDAGARRYLLRHETACKKHYEMLHPADMSFDNRMNCLQNLKEIGYQVGCGFMIGSPFQTKEMLADDLLFIQNFKPHMVGIGPFISHKDTIYANMSNGTLEDTLLLLSILRLMQPTLLLPATTALGTIHPKGRELGIQAGANVTMPNLTPTHVRAQYSLYDNKICTGDESAQCIQCMKTRIEGIGYKIVVDRGDSPDI